MVAVRDARPDDAADVQRVVDAAFARLRTIYRPSAEAIAHAKTLPLERLVATDDDAIVGTVQFRVDGAALRVVGLAVAPAWQRRGVARMLLDRLAEVATQRGCRVLVLFTIQQTGNVAIFRRLGFELMWEQPDAWSESVSGDALIECYLERGLLS